MAKKKPDFKRRWYYRSYFGGVAHLDVSPETTQEEVAEEIGKKEGHDNWVPNSLLRGQKVKVR